MQRLDNYGPSTNQRGSTTPQRGNGFRAGHGGHGHSRRSSHHHPTVYAAHNSYPPTHQEPTPRSPLANPPPPINGESAPQINIHALAETVSRLCGDMALIFDENVQLKGEIAMLKTAMNSQREKIVSLEQEIDDLEQYGRRENVCFSNLKFGDTQPVMKQVISLCDELNITVTEEDFVDVHPLPSKRGYAKRVVARFKDRKLGQKVMGARKSTKNIGSGKKTELAADPSRGFGIQPNIITPKRSALLKQAKAAVEKAGFNEAWIDVKNCAVLIRTKPGERPRVIRNTHDIMRIVPDFKPMDFVFCVDESQKFVVFDNSLCENSSAVKE